MLTRFQKRKMEDQTKTVETSAQLSQNVRDATAPQQLGSNINQMAESDKSPMGRSSDLVSAHPTASSTGVTHTDALMSFLLQMDAKLNAKLEANSAQFEAFKQENTKLIETKLDDLKRENNAKLNELINAHSETLSKLDKHDTQITSLDEKVEVVEISIAKNQGALSDVQSDVKIHSELLKKHDNKFKTIEQKCDSIAQVDSDKRNFLQKQCISTSNEIKARLRDIEQQVQQLSNPQNRFPFSEVIA